MQNSFAVSRSRTAVDGVCNIAKITAGSLLVYVQPKSNMNFKGQKKVWRKLRFACALAVNPRILSMLRVKATRAIPVR